MQQGEVQSLQGAGCAAGDYALGNFVGGVGGRGIREAHC